jgi:hypothetical protein
MGKKRYTVNGERFTIPLEKEKDFLKDFPNAEEVHSYEVGKETFHIPVSKEQDFLRDMPDAKPLGSPVNLVQKNASWVYDDKPKKKEDSGSTSEVQVSESKDTTVDGITQDGFRKIDTKAIKVQTPIETMEFDMSHVPTKPETSLDFVVNNVGSVMKGLAEFGVAYSEALQGNSANPVQSAIDQVQYRARDRRKYLEGYDPSKLEELASFGLGLLLDAPVFGAGGAVGRTASKPLIKALGLVKQNMLKEGVEQVTAKELTKNLAKKYAANVIQSTASSATALGSYEGLMNVKDQIESGVDLEDVEWSESLKATGHGSLIGSSLGPLAPTFGLANKYLNNIMSKGIGKQAATIGLKAAEIPIEASVFTAVGSSLDKEPMSWESYWDNVLMVGVMKGTGAIQKIKDYSKENAQTYGIEFKPEEAKIAKDKVDVETMEGLDLQPSKIETLLKDKQVPLTAKAKLLWRFAGVRADKLDMSPYDVSISKQGEGATVKVWNKDKELVDLQDFATWEQADNTAFKVLQQASDLKLWDEARQLTLQQKQKVSDKLGSLQDINEISLIPIFERSPEQQKKVVSFRDAISKVKEEEAKEAEKEATVKEKGSSKGITHPKEDNAPEPEAGAKAGDEGKGLEINESSFINNGIKYNTIEAKNKDNVGISLIEKEDGRYTSGTEIKSEFIGKTKEDAIKYVRNELGVPQIPQDSKEMVGEIPGKERPAIPQEEGATQEASKEVTTKTVKLKKLLEKSKTTNVTKESSFLLGGGRKIKISFKPTDSSKSDINTFESILKEFSDATGKTIRFRKQKGKLGSYSPATTSTIAKSNDLRTASHEIGHYIDDKFNIVEKIPQDKINIIHKELYDLSNTGSKPGVNIENKDRYIKSEGIGEYISAYVANPIEAEKMAPEFTNHLKNTIDPKHLQAIDKLSDNVREWYSLPAEKRAMYGVQMQERRPTIKERIFGELFPREFKVTAIDRFTEWFLNPNRVYEKAWRTMVDRIGLKPQEITGDKNFLKTARLLYGTDNKTWKFYNDGLQNFNGDDILRDGKKINGEWLIDPLAKISKNAKELNELYENAISVGIAERVLELNSNKETKQILEDIKNGKLPPQRILEEHSDLYENRIGDKKVSEIISDLRGKKTQEQYIGRYDFTNDDYTSAGGGFLRSYDEAVETLINHEQLKESNKGRYDAINESLNRYRTFSDEVLKYALDGGRITKDQYDHIKKNNQYYISFGRIQSNDTFGEYYPETDGSGKGAVGSVRQIINKIKGSKKTIQNPYVSLIDNMNRIIQDTDRNASLRTFTDMLDVSLGREMGEAGRVVLDDIGKKINNKEDGKHVLTIYTKDGESYYDVNKDIYDSLKQIGNNASDVKVLSWTLGLPIRILEKTVTTFPVFAARNRIRDFGSRLGFTQAKFKFSDLTQKKKFISELNKKGGGQFGYMMNKPNYYFMQSEIIKQSAKGNHIVINPLKVDRLWDKYKRILERSEQGTRAEEYKAVYEQSIKNGMSHKDASVEAAFAARDLMDFSVSGTLIKYLRWTAPFINPRIQGIRKLVNTAKNNPIKLAANFALYGISPILIEKMLISLAKRDDDYIKLPDYRKDMFYNIPNPLGDGWIIIPKPFELGVLASASTRWIDKIVFGDERPYETDYVKWLFSSISPVDESAITGQSNPIKNAIQNKDPFRQTDIIPDYEIRKPLILREGTKYASRWGQLFEPVGVDPRMADYLTKSMFTYYGDMITGLSDIGREDRKKYDIVAKTGFFKQDSPYNNKDFIEIKKYVSAYNKYRDHRYEEAREMIDKYYTIKDPNESREYRSIMNKYFESLLGELKKEEAEKIQKAKQEKLKKK